MNDVKPWTAGWIKCNASDAAEYFLDSDYYALAAELAQGREREQSLCNSLDTSDAEYDKMDMAHEKRIAQLEAALTKAADTFLDMERTCLMLGRTILASACRVAEAGSREALRTAAETVAERTLQSQVSCTSEKTKGDAGG